jgi:hypothetical protein
LTAGTGLLAVPFGAGGGPGASATSPAGGLGTVSISRGKRGSVGVPLLTATVDALPLLLNVRPADSVDSDGFTHQTVLLSVFIPVNINLFSFI